MSDFLAELGKKLADRWLELLVLPGLLWIAAAAAAIRLGQRHAFDVARLRVSLDHIASRPAGHSLASVALVVAGALAAAATAGLVAGALGGLLQRMWVLPGHDRLTAKAVGLRVHRWKKAAEASREAFVRAAGTDPHQVDLRRAAEAQVRHAERRRAALGLTKPERPTWIGERFRTVAARVEDAYGLELGITWPRLWVLLPESLRTDLSDAQSAYADAARLTGWGVLYAALTVSWWPALPVGAIVVGTGWMRARAATAVLVDLIETAFDLHAVDLAAKLGFPADAPLPPDTGRSIGRILRKVPGNAQP